MIYNLRNTYQNEDNDNFKNLPNFIFLYYYLTIYAKFYKFKYITPTRLEKALKVDPKQFINDPEKDICELFSSFIKKVLYRKGWENNENKWIKTLGYIMNDEFAVNHPLIPERGLYNISNSTPIDRLEILKVLCELQIREHRDIRNFTKRKFKKLKINYLDLMGMFFIGNDSNGNKFYNTYGAILYKIDKYNKIFVFQNTIEGIEQFIKSLTKNNDKKLKLNLKNIIEDLKEYEKKKNEYVRRYLDKPTKYEIQMEQENLRKRKLHEEKEASANKNLNQRLKEEYLAYREIYIPNDEENINIELLKANIEKRKTEVNYESLCLRLEKVFQFDRNFDSRSVKNTNNNAESININKIENDKTLNYESLKTENREDIKNIKKNEEIKTNTIISEQKSIGKKQINNDKIQKSDEKKQNDNEKIQKNNEKEQINNEKVQKSNDKEQRDNEKEKRDNEKNVTRRNEILESNSNHNEILKNNNDQNMKIYENNNDDNIMDYTLIEPLINTISYINVLI